MVTIQQFVSTPEIYYDMTIITYLAGSSLHILLNLSNYKIFTGRVSFEILDDGGICDPR